MRTLLLLVLAWPATTTVASDSVGDAVAREKDVGRESSPDPGRVVRLKTVLLAPIQAVAGAAGHPQLTTCVSGIPIPQRAEIEVERIFAHAGVRIVWSDVHCTVSVIVLEHPPRALYDRAGSAVLDATTRRGSVAYVYANAIAERTRHLPKIPSLEDWIGRVIAHEAGHLLGLSHDPTGRSVMRGTFGPRNHHRSADWRFSKAEAAAIRAALTPGGSPVHRGPVP
jgi:hypothetical protein